MQDFLKSTNGPSLGVSVPGALGGYLWTIILILLDLSIGDEVLSQIQAKAQTKCWGAEQSGVVGPQETSPGRSHPEFVPDSYEARRVL